MTPDPYRATIASVNNPSNPQSWNRYAYVLGDPVNMNDRRGLDGQLASQDPGWCDANPDDGSCVGGLYGAGYPCPGGEEFESGPNPCQDEVGPAQHQQGPTDPDPFDCFVQLLRQDAIFKRDPLQHTIAEVRALEMFKHQIAFERTEESYVFRGLRELHIDVWQRGPLTAFYVREKLSGADPGLRTSYLFGKDGLRGGGTCPAEKNWRECVQGFAHLQYATDVVGTCEITLDTNTIPAWMPSPNDASKRRIANELRNEIEPKWPGVLEIVVRDFNLKDNQITMYLKMPDGDYYQGCDFDAMSEPHCGGWHLFGNAPNSSIRKWIFERPYRLK